MLRSFRKFRKHKKGSTSVEFALLALPFFGLLLSLLETSLVFLADQTLDTAVQNAARQIRTGQVQQNNVDASGFKDMVCSDIVVFFDCQANLVVDVDSYPSFSDAGAGFETKRGEAFGTPELVDTVTNFDPGSGSDIVVVQAYVKYPMVLMADFTVQLDNTGNREKLLFSNATFRNEPFTW